MIIVLGDDYYYCDKEKLPHICYYFNDRDNCIIGKFGNIHISIHQGGYKQEYISCDELLVHDSYPISDEMNDFARDLDLLNYDSFCLNGREVDISEYLGFLCRHKEEIDLLKLKILDFYIKHKPNSTKSSNYNVCTHYDAYSHDDSVYTL